jgi:hypothetical protein
MERGRLSGVEWRGEERRGGRMGRGRKERAGQEVGKKEVKKKRTGKYNKKDKRIDPASAFGLTQEEKKANHAIEEQETGNSSPITGCSFLLFPGTEPYLPIMSNGYLQPGPWAWGGASDQSLISDSRTEREQFR